MFAYDSERSPYCWLDIPGEPYIVMHNLLEVLHFLQFAPGYRLQGTEFPPQLQVSC
jgi:hypothetical protein